MASQGDRLAAFVREVARLNYDGEELAGELFEMENDDAVSTLSQLILDARSLTAAEILAAVAAWVDAAPTDDPRYPLNEGHALNLGDAIDGMAPDDWARFGVLWVASPTTRATFEVDHDDPLAFPD
jgi:hypothetical protein